MTYKQFENIVSARRMERYLIACHGDNKQARRLYRENMRLACEMFIVVSGFEIALRNAIHNKVSARLGEDWLGKSVKKGGIFYSLPPKAKRNIVSTAKKLKVNNKYDADQMVASMKFGTWKYMFSKIQYEATGQCLLKIFPNKPKSSKVQQYDRKYFFNELDHVNSLRNRLAHHEPICFTHYNDEVDLSYAKSEYDRIIKLFVWMGIDHKSLFKGTDQVQTIFTRIDTLFPITTNIAN
jgi:hypothetical protein